MSRIGKKIIAVPQKVKVNIKDGLCVVEGPLGRDQLKLDENVKVVVGQNGIQIERIDNSIRSRLMHGSTRALIQNLVTGLSDGFKKVLDINGVGYRAEVKGEELNMTLGFSHPVIFKIPKGVKIAVEKQTRLIVSGTKRDLVGQVASEIRDFKPPEPYKGKGIKYENEHIERKVGKAAAGAGSK